MHLYNNTDMLPWVKKWRWNKGWWMTSPFPNVIIRRITHDGLKLRQDTRISKLFMIQYGKWHIRIQQCIAYIEKRYLGHIILVSSLQSNQKQRFSMIWLLAIMSSIRQNFFPAWSRSRDNHSRRRFKIVKLPQQVTGLRITHNDVKPLLPLFEVTVYRGKTDAPWATKR